MSTSSSSKFLKSANILEILTWYCSLIDTSFSLLRLNISISYFCTAHLLTLWWQILTEDGVATANPSPEFLCIRLYSQMMIRACTLCLTLSLFHDVTGYPLPGVSFSKSWPLWTCDVTQTHIQVGCHLFAVCHLKHLQCFCAWFSELLT